MRYTILKRTEGIYTFHVYCRPDDDPDLSWLTDISRYEGCTPEEIADDTKQDKDRLEDYDRGDWYMVGVCCDVSVKTKTNWAVDPVVARSSVWGVESDSDQSYFLELAEEQIHEAKADLANLRRALCKSPAMRGGISK